ncbi:Azurin [compost metagenome]
MKDGDTRIIAHTKVIGAKESDSVTFDVSKLDANEKYGFFCSFPGHISMMKGTVTLK